MLSPTIYPPNAPCAFAPPCGAYPIATTHFISPFFLSPPLNHIAIKHRLRCLPRRAYLNPQHTNPPFLSSLNRNTSTIHPPNTLACLPPPCGAYPIRNRSLYLPFLSKLRSQPYSHQVRRHLPRRAYSLIASLAFPFFSHIKKTLHSTIYPPNAARPHLPR